MPVARGAPRRPNGLALTCAQGQERADFGAHPAPLFPLAHAETPPPPVVQLRAGTVVVRDAEVMHPASDVAREPFQPIGHRHAPRAPGELPDAVLEVGDGLLGPTPFGAPEGAAEAHDRLGPTHPALGLVHAELQLRGQNARAACLDALTGAPAVDQYQQVVGIRREAVATALQRLYQGRPTSHWRAPGRAGSLERSPPPSPG